MRKIRKFLRAVILFLYVCWPFGKICQTDDYQPHFTSLADPPQPPKINGVRSDGVENSWEWLRLAETELASDLDAIPVEGSARQRGLLHPIEEFTCPDCGETNQSNAFSAEIVTYVGDAQFTHVRLRCFSDNCLRFDNRTHRFDDDSLAEHMGAGCIITLDYSQPGYDVIRDFDWEDDMPLPTDASDIQRQIQQVAILQIARNQTATNLPPKDEL